MFPSCSLQPFWEAWFTPELSKPQETLSGERGGHLTSFNQGTKGAVPALSSSWSCVGRTPTCIDHLIGPSEKEMNNNALTKQVQQGLNGHMFQLHFVNLGRLKLKSCSNFLRNPRQIECLLSENDTLVTSAPPNCTCDRPAKKQVKQRGPVPREEIHLSGDGSIFGCVWK